MDNKLNFKEHIKSVHKKISRAIFTLNQMKNILDQKHLKLLANAYIRSHIEYCSNIFSACNQSTIKPLNLVLKRAVRLVSGKGRFEHTKPLFKNLDILPVPQLIEYNALIFMYSCHNKKANTGAHNSWVRTRDRNNRDLRNAQDFDFPRARLAMYENMPYLKFPKLWNELEQNIKDSTSISIFKRALREKLFNEIPN